MNLLNLSMRAVIATAEELGEERLANAARNGQEAAKLDKEWVKSKEESIDRVALKYRKEGVDGAEAFEKARGEQLNHKKKLDCNFILNETKSSGVSIIIVVY